MSPNVWCLLHAGHSIQLDAGIEHPVAKWKQELAIVVVPVCLMDDHLPCWGLVLQSKQLSELSCISDSKQACL